MFPKLRVMAGLALLLSLLTVIKVYAKGGFAFIAVTGPNLKEAVRLADPELITDFFAFADFYRDRTEAPAEPGLAYEITRYYLDGRREIPFDRLHYYPDTGFVFYDGIVNGSSEYDGEWYSARPEVRSIFGASLSTPVKPAESVVPLEPIQAAGAAQVPAREARSESLTMAAVIAGLAAVVALAAFWLRRSVAR